MSAEVKSLGEAKVLTFLLIVAFVFVVCLVFVVAFIYFELSGYVFDGSAGGYLGTLGDFIGGLLNPFAAILSFILLAYTLYQNSLALRLSQAELALTREELTLTRVELQRQADASLEQSSTFSRQLNLEERRSEYSMVCAFHEQGSRQVQELCAKERIITQFGGLTFNGLVKTINAKADNRISWIDAAPIAGVALRLNYMLSDMLGSYLRYIERFGSDGMLFHVEYIKSVSESVVFILDNLHNVSLQSSETLADANIIDNHSINSLIRVYDSIVSECDCILNDIKER